MSIENLIIKLKPKLVKKIEDAINETDDELQSENTKFPWLGENCYHILADAVINVIRGMQDSQDYMEREEMLK